MSHRCHARVLAKRKLDADQRRRERDIAPPNVGPIADRTLGMRPHVLANPKDGDNLEADELGINLGSSNRSKSMRACVRPLQPLLFLSLCVLGLWAGQTSPSPTTKRATSTPYTGDLSIFDSPGREQRLQINRVMDILGIAPGKGVADIGAGSGWFTVRAARRVGPSGTVYAVDINPEAIRYVDRRVHNESLPNVRTILSKPDDPMLPKETVDAVLLLKTYHEVADPIALLGHLRPALKPGAQLGIIDRNGNGTDHGVSAKIVIEEARQAGYRLVKSYDFVKADDNTDYFLIFTP
jgi:Methyltransferase domain